VRGCERRHTGSSRAVSPFEMSQPRPLQSPPPGDIPDEVGQGGSGGAGRALSAFVRLARPSHWIKNAFVVVPLPFALVGPGEFQPAVFLLGLAGFCLVNSAVYVFNDLIDAPADRLHPRKGGRPIAAGEVSPGAAARLDVALIVAGAGMVVATGVLNAILLVTLYVGVNVAYSLGAKRKALLDVFLLSSGFVIRVSLGCALVGVAPSNWLLLCSSALALFLGFAKRRADLYAGVSDDGHGVRGASLLRAVQHGLKCPAGRSGDGGDAVRGLRYLLLPAPGPYEGCGRFSSGDRPPFSNPLGVLAGVVGGRDVEPWPLVTVSRSVSRPAPARIGRLEGCAGLGFASPPQQRPEVPHGPHPRPRRVAPGTDCAAHRAAP
jgi:hypothetical protein